MTGVAGGLVLVVDDVPERRFTAKPEQFTCTALSGVDVPMWLEKTGSLGIKEVLVVVRSGNESVATGVVTDFETAAAATGTELVVNTTHAMDTTPESKAAQEDDTSLALHFIRAQQHSLRYVGDVGRWLIWDGRVWVGLYDDRSERQVKGRLQLHLATMGRERAHAIIKDAEKGTAEEKQAAYALAVKVETDYRSTRRLNAVWSAVEVRAAVSPKLRIEQADLNRNPEILNCANGMASLRTGELLPHDAQELCTAISPYSYRTDEPVYTPTFDRFIAECHPDPDGGEKSGKSGESGEGDREVIGYLQRRAGLCAYGAQRSHVFCIDMGTLGRNGKGRFAELLVAVLGDYAVTARSEILLITRQDRHLTQIASLVHRRFVWVDETRASRSLDGAQVKMLTGGAPLRANFMRQDEFSFVPRFTIVLTTNEAPKFEGADRALGARLQIVPWEVSFAGREDEDLLDKLKAEGDGILSWIVRGAVLYLGSAVGGLEPPGAVVEMTQEERREHDPTGQWFDARLYETDDKTADGDDIFLSTDWLYSEYTRLFVGDLTARSFSMRLSGWLAEQEWSKTKAVRRTVGGKQWRGWTGVGYRNSGF